MTNEELQDHWITETQEMEMLSVSYANDFFLFVKE